MRTDLYKAIPGDATDSEGLTALLERYLLWMETHHYAQGTIAIRRVTLSKFNHSVYDVQFAPNLPPVCRRPSCEPFIFPRKMDRYLFKSGPHVTDRPCRPGVWPAFAPGRSQE